jgi:integrase
LRTRIPENRIGPDVFRKTGSFLHSENVGLGRIGWHTFRHSHSSLLHALGVDLKVQQELLRHADIRTTMNIYTHAVPAALREANSKVVNLVLPAQVACEFNAPLSSLENLQLTMDVGILLLANDLA